MNTKKVTLTPQERKLKALQLVEKTYIEYPEWRRQSYKLPEPTYASKLVNVKMSHKQMAQIPMDDISKSVLCGTLIGDSSIAINKGFANARYQNRHSTRQMSWFVWKHLVVLKQFTNESGVSYQESDGYQQNVTPMPGEILGKVKIASKASPELTALHKIIVDGGKKSIQRSWLNPMNSYFLMTLWLDDGSLMNNRQGVICLNSTPRREQTILRDYLLKVWGIETSSQQGHVMTNGQVSYRITIDNVESLLKLLRLIAPLIPVREMLYKICFVPVNNPSLLQRWKTEVLGLVRPEFVDQVKKFYDTI